MANTLPQPRRDLQRLRKRADFLKARSGFYAAGAFVRVQMNARDDDDASPRIGFTVTRKNGNAVIRNRIKRRLRAAVDAMPETLWHKNTDYVVISKPESLAAPFDALKADLAAVISKAERRMQANSKHN